MDAKQLGTLADSVVQIYSLSAVAKNFTDSHYMDDNMLHIGLMMDKIYEQSTRLKALLESYQVIP
ncbi:TPA: hypothetical protein IAC10_10470 [Candidatus Scatousia excrementigallinarum]|uniref:Uncharacterized protein n=1 Tax=Candidatus Scatousia excrementigallinarum TaxID=2840935 RepID=A0A9D1F127_9BACT|nr:hypothetical protein [Candidatus Scatousia excrementigallinarum]